MQAGLVAQNAQHMFKGDKVGRGLDHGIALLHDRSQNEGFIEYSSYCSKEEHKSVAPLSYKCLKLIHAAHVIYFARMASFTSHRACRY